MPIDNISLINTKGSIDGIYVFDIPSPEDEDANITYILIMYKDGTRSIERLTNYQSLFNLLTKYDTDAVKQRTRKYDTFIETISTYLDKVNKKEQDTSLSEEDINMINNQFRTELDKKGNTDLLKKLKIGRKHTHIPVTQDTSAPELGPLARQSGRCTSPHVPLLSLFASSDRPLFLTFVFLNSSRIRVLLGFLHLLRIKLLSQISSA